MIYSGYKKYSIGEDYGKGLYHIDRDKALLRT